jgi:predicted nucleic-acid-binding protein
MNGIDTNVFVRIFVDDGSPEHQMAADLSKDGGPFFVSTIVAVEAAWVLTRAYRFPKQQLHTLLSNALAATLFEFEDRRLIELALQAFLKGSADFSDYAVLAANERAQALPLLSFDKTLGKEAGVRLLRTRRRG